MTHTARALVLAVLAALVVLSPVAFAVPAPAAAQQAPPPTIDSPPGRYVVGTPTTLAGTGSPNASVAVYVRADGDWQLLDLDGDGERTAADAADVAANGTWRQSGVVLSQASPLLSQPGQYSLGVVVAGAVGGDGDLPATLSPDAFEAAGGAARPLVVEPPPFVEPGVFRDVNNQVATGDGTVRVRGTARGVDEVLVVMVDRRGAIASTIVSVDDDDVFEDDDVPLVSPDGTPLAEGPIAATVYSAGRDGVMGDGELAGFTESDLPELVAFVRQRAAAGGPAARTQQQVLELFAAESVAEAGSDDLFLADFFTFTDGRTSIESVAPTAGANATGAANATDEPARVGHTLLVRGLTNRKPDDNTITVEVVEGPTPEAFGLPATDEWGDDGVWQVELDTAGAEPGTYVLEADDGDDTDRFQVTLLPAENATNATRLSGTGAREPT